jgi:hypothetical protein
MATQSNCGNFLRAFTTTHRRKRQWGTRLIAEPNGKNVKDWIIRSQAPKLAMIEYGEGSETRWLWFVNEGLINLIRNKV